MSSSRQQRNGAALPPFDSAPYSSSKGKVFSPGSGLEAPLPTPPSPVASYTHHYGGSSNRAFDSSSSSDGHTHAANRSTQPLSSPGLTSAAAAARSNGTTLIGTAGGAKMRPTEHVGAAPTPPARPPKPAALRVKKAKAYSISLLAGSTAPFARAAKGGADYGPVVAATAGRSSEEASPRTSDFAELPPTARPSLGAATRHYEDQDETPSHRIARLAMTTGVRSALLQEEDGEPVHVIGRSHSNSTPLPLSAQLRPPVLPPRLPGAGDSNFLGSLDTSGSSSQLQDWLYVSSYDDATSLAASSNLLQPSVPPRTHSSSNGTTKLSEAQSYAASFAAALDSPALALGDTLRTPGSGGVVRPFERTASAPATAPRLPSRNETATTTTTTTEARVSDYASTSKRLGRRKASLGSASLFDGLLRGSAQPAARSPTTPSAPVEPLLNAHTVAAQAVSNVSSSSSTGQNKRKLPPVITQSYNSSASGAKTAPLAAHGHSSFGAMQASTSNPLTLSRGEATTSSAAAAAAQPQRTVPSTQPPSPAKSEFGLRFGIKSKQREGSPTVDSGYARTGGGGYAFNARFMRSSDQLATPSHSEQGHGSARTSAAPIQPPPQRRKRDSWRDSDTHSLAGYGGGGGGNAVVHALGQMGAAVGKKGWDMMRSWNSNQVGAVGAGYEDSSLLHSAYAQRTSVAPDLNEATRKWLNAPDASATSSRASGAKASIGTVFGAPLREVVLATRLGNIPPPGHMSITYVKSPSRPLSQLDALDLGSDFHVPLSLDGSSPIERNANSSLLSRSGTARQGRSAASRQEARKRYLPAVVVRCVEALEKWGADEEGIYRLSGRSSHTAKLRLIFDVAPQSHSAPTQLQGDLKLDDIGPADLDLNSVCSLLKHYLRELPEPLLTKELGPAFDRAALSAAGTPATGTTSGGMFGGGAASTAGGVVASASAGKLGTAGGNADTESLSSLIATAVKPLIRKLPACNWYLLRELADHLGDLCKPDVVAHTKMPLSNLSLVIAPTMSLSVVMVRALVEHRATLFGGDGPTPDAELDGSLACDAGALLAPCDSRSTPLGWSVIHGHGNTATPRPSAHASYDTTSVRKARPPLPSRETKRSSTLTVTAANDVEYAKRESVATLRGTFEEDREPAPPTPSVPPPLRSMKNSRQPTPIVLADDDGIDDAAAPIAARFQRQRTLSSATTLSVGGLSSLGQPLKAQGSSSSLASRSGSGNGSGKLRIGGDDASSSSNGHGWEGSDAGHSATSHDSVAGTSALSRPRPPTSGGTRFFANKGTAAGGAPLVAPSTGARTRRAGTGQSLTPSTDSHGSMTSSASPHGPSFGSQGHSASTLSTSTSGSIDSLNAAAVASGQRKRGYTNAPGSHSTPVSPAVPHGFASSKSDLAHSNHHHYDGPTDLARILRAQNADAGVEARRRACEGINNKNTSR